MTNSIGIKARMFDLQKEADRLKEEYEGKLRPVRDRYQKLSNQLQEIDEEEFNAEKEQKCEQS